MTYQEKVDAIDAKLKELFNEWCKQAPIAQRLLGQKDVYLESMNEGIDLSDSPVGEKVIDNDA